jgi:hypothetical protein
MVVGTSTPYSVQVELGTVTYCSADDWAGRVGQSPGSGFSASSESDRIND